MEDLIKKLKERRSNKILEIGMSEYKSKKPTMMDKLLLYVLIP
jgi:hypothetical protein